MQERITCQGPGHVIKLPRKANTMNIQEVVVRRYIDKDDGFEFTFLPVNDTLTVKETPDGYEARYLVQDDDPTSPEEDADDNAFLVHYHRDFWVERKNILSRDDLANWYRQDFEDYKDEPDDEGPGSFPLAEKYHIFPVSALIHSGVWLSLSHYFDCDSQGWDTSHVGAIFISKEEWNNEEKAYEYAKGMLETWNSYLSGDVYGIVKETYNKDKNQVDYDSCWGFYGHEYALEELKGM